MTTKPCKYKISYQLSTKKMVKTKIKKYKGYYCLVVDDPMINKKYECSQDDPILLATMTNFFDSGCWSVEDFRLSQYKTPSPYLEGIDQCVYEIKTEEEKENLIKRLHTYREIEDKNRKVITWNTFDKALWDGDNPYCIDKFGYVQNIIARFSYAKALEKLNEIKEFWNNFDDTNLMNGKITNPYRQISEMTLMIEEEIEKERKQKSPKMK